MSLADESNIPHRPPQVGDRVEVRLAGPVVALRDDGRQVGVDVGGGVIVWRRADEVAILRDLLRYTPGHTEAP